MDIEERHGADGSTGLSADESVLDPGRIEKVKMAVRAWVRQLVNLGGQNRLLFYREFPRATLDLTPGREGMRVPALESLLAGRRVTLRELFTDDGVRVEASKRCRTIYAKSLENYEERGIETLFLGWGMATWVNPRTETVPAAPVLLNSLSVSPRGQAGDEYSISLIGDWEINPSLLHALSQALLTLVWVG